jgi:positive phototaxis protein PixI
MSAKIELQAIALPTEEFIPYFCLQLDPTTVGLIDMKYAQEVLIVPADRLTLMPNMPDQVLGLFPHRNRIFWIIDLPQLLGLPPLAIDAYHVIILHIQDVWVGLAGVRSQGMRRFSNDQIVSPVGNVSVELERFLRGCILEEEGMIFVLDGEAIANY